jgi:hypothetical protein
MYILESFNEEQKIIAKRYIANFLKRIELAKAIHEELAKSPSVPTPEGLLITEQLKKTSETNVELIESAKSSGLAVWAKGFQFSLMPFLNSDDFIKDVKMLLNDKAAVLILPTQTGSSQHVILTGDENLDALHTYLKGLGYLDSDLIHFNDVAPFAMPVIEGLVTLKDITEADKFLGK